MNLYYICANQIRETLTVDSEPYINAAKEGTLYEKVRGLVDQATALHTKAGKMPDFAGIVGITFSGALNEPDNRSLDTYNELGMTIYCEWSQTAKTAHFQIRAMIDQSNFFLKDLRVTECRYVLDAPGGDSGAESPPGRSAAYPSEDFPALERQVTFPTVSAFYGQCGSIFHDLLNGQTNTAQTAISTMESESLPPVEKQMQQVQALLTSDSKKRKRNGDNDYRIYKDYFEVLEANLALMKGFIGNLHIAAV